MSSKVISHPAALLLLCAICSCARTVSESVNVSAQRALSAWLSTHDVGQTVKTGHGIYITCDRPGNGVAVKDSQYVFLKFRYSTLEDSTLVNYTDEGMARQLGKYQQYYYYGSIPVHAVKSDIPTGLLDLIHGSGPDDPQTPHWDTLRIGGYREGIIPGWLTSTEYDFETEEEYMAKVSGSNYYYKIYLDGITDDIEQWQQDTIRKVMVKTGKVASDSTVNGVWYWRDLAREKKRKVEVIDSIALHFDTTIYINYIGRLLNGQVFDTNIEDTAKMYGLYDATNSYEPVSVTCSTDSTSIKMSSSSVISGFGFTIWEMHPFESGRGIFPARLGYGSSGNLPTIPGYAPLIFDIDIVEDPDD